MPRIPSKVIAQWVSCFQGSPEFRRLREVLRAILRSRLPPKVSDEEIAEIAESQEAETATDKYLPIREDLHRRNFGI